MTLSLPQSIAGAILLTALGVAASYGLMRLEERLPRRFSPRMGVLILVAVFVAAILWTAFAPDLLGSIWPLAILAAYWTGRRVGQPPKREGAEHARRAEPTPAITEAPKEIER